MVDAYKFLGNGLVGQHRYPLQVLEFVHKAATDVLQWSEASMNGFAVVCFAAEVVWATLAQTS